MRGDPRVPALLRSFNGVQERLQASGNDGSIEGMRSRVGTLWPLRQPIGYLLGANFNSTADQAITINEAGGFVIRRIVVASASVSLTTAAGGIYTGPSKGGTTIVAAAQVYAALTGHAKYLDLTLQAVCLTDWFVESPLFLSLTTAQGSAATASVFVFGDQFPAT